MGTTIKYTPKTQMEKTRMIVLSVCLSFTLLGCTEVRDTRCWRRDFVSCDVMQLWAVTRLLRFYEHKCDHSQIGPMGMKHSNTARGKWSSFSYTKRQHFCLDIYLLLDKRIFLAKSEKIKQFLTVLTILNFVICSLVTLSWKSMSNCNHDWALIIWLNENNKWNNHFGRPYSLFL